jgi:spore maturation protein B
MTRKVGSSMFESTREILDGTSQWAIPILILVIVLWAGWRRVPMYESFISGAKEGFDVAVMIIPYLVAILFAIKIFLASGMFDDLKMGVAQLLAVAGWEDHVDLVDLLPLALTRPLTGGGARGVMLDIFDRHGSDSLVGMTATVMMGSTETTFYILAVYFGSIRIKKLRHTLPACLWADVAGILSSVVIGLWLYGS